MTHIRIYRDPWHGAIRAHRPPTDVVAAGLQSAARHHAGTLTASDAGHSPVNPKSLHRWLEDPLT